MKSEPFSKSRGAELGKLSISKGDQKRRLQNAFVDFFQQKIGKKYIMTEAVPASAVQRNLVRIESPGNVASTASSAANASKTFMARVRLFCAFVVGVGIGAVSLSVFFKEFSSPTSLRPSTLATTTDQFMAMDSDGNPIIKTHLQTTNYVKAAVPTKRMNKTAEMPTKADFVVEEKITKPSIVSKTTALFAKNTTKTSSTTSNSSTTGGESKTTTTTTTTTTKAPDMRVSTPVGVASIKAPLKPLNISTIMSKNNGTLPKAVIPLSTTNPKTLKATTKPTAAVTKKPLSTSKTVASKKDKDEGEDKEVKEEKDDKKDDKVIEVKDTDKKYNIDEGHENVDIGDKDERDKLKKIERRLRNQV